MAVNFRETAPCLAGKLVAVAIKSKSVISVEYNFAILRGVG